MHECGGNAAALTEEIVLYAENQRLFALYRHNETKGISLDMPFILNRLYILIAPELLGSPFVCAQGNSMVQCSAESNFFRSFKRAFFSMRDT